MPRRLTLTLATATVAALAAAGLAAPASAAPQPPPGGEPVEAGITVPKVTGMGEDWINGADFSSVLSLEESGVTFYDRDGEPGDLFEILADAEVNWARVRVWNEPFLASDPSKGYGAGNTDAERATEIGRRATEAGMRVLVNFHYSDFWAHPGQQYTPRAWAGLDDAARAQAIYDYTSETLADMKAAGVDVGMVQVGNETTSGEIAGVRGWDRTAALFQAGSRAVRDTLGDDVKVAVHFTNPERVGQYANVAAALDARGVDYDVFLSSYYAFWHGTPANLTSVLSDIATRYDKEVAVAETSWVHTLEDGDGMPNSVRSTNGAYATSEQGQALAVRDVMQAVADVPDGKGIGTFYWEPAWLPVGPPDQLEENTALWNRDGSGWATPYAQDFYRPATGWYEGIPESEWADDFGGSGWDNQALFDFAGHPLESLRVYEYARTGSIAPRAVETIESPRIGVGVGEPVVLPSTVAVTWNDGTTEQQSVTWSDDVAWIDGAGTYTVRGTTAVGAVTATVVVRAANQGTNLVRNPGFEERDAGWTREGTGITVGGTENPFAGARSANFYSGAAFSFAIEQRVENVPPGSYILSAKAQGGNAGASDTLSISAQSGISTVRAPFTLQGWQVWQTPTTEPISVGADGVVVVRAEGALSAGAWGSLDEFSLVAVADEVAVDTAALEAAVAEVDGVDRPRYTSASLAVLDAALVRSSFVLGSEAPSQASVDGAAAQLTTALAGLERRAFTDVADENQFATEISWLARAGISTGWVDAATGEAQFRPLAPIARDAMAAFLFRMLGDEEWQAPEVSPFVDVATTDQFYKEIAWLAESGISTGWATPAGAEFRPLQPIARDAMAAFLYRAADSPAHTAPSTSPFSDVTPATQFYSEITWMLESGVATGWVGNDGTSDYKPLNPVARDAMAAFLYRFHHEVRAAG
ncbi:glycosyl hydrolase 53 family protein [Litorihabitans aurantiacus]|uniref:Arabinogalactan endo-beta-1,4-galactanase n=1 Tax=Litorihabitans aurantiacus TaxID=1930061 RepID=A0AA37XHQ3_9MICO|nr:glycosyl hydrolase 53 family protein [Litorihabitans aurantiacus]GMA33139.1 arabinogalactan endo-beta-1,4-galactanase [Litorihabitans aurantiacus]